MLNSDGDLEPPVSSIPDASDQPTTYDLAKRRTDGLDRSLVPLALTVFLYFTFFLTSLPSCVVLSASFYNQNKITTWRTVKDTVNLLVFITHIASEPGGVLGAAVVYSVHL